MPQLPPPVPPGLPVVLTRADAKAAGITEGQLRHLVRSGDWVRISHGTYLRSTHGNTHRRTQHDVARARHRLAAEIAAARQSDAVIALGSAAIVHGLPLVTGTPREAHLMVPPGAFSGRRAGAQFHESRNHAGSVNEVVSALGTPVLVTSVERTWVDIARRGLLADALSTGDAALRSGAMTLDSADAELARLGPVRGIRRAQRALGLLDPLRESPLESGSAARFIEWGFPQPRLQHDWWDVDGFIARSDADWEKFAVIGFADGMGKYDLDPSRDRAERVQESRLRPYATVVRWGWSDAAGTGIGLFRLLAPLLKHEQPFPQRPLRW